MSTATRVLSILLAVSVVLNAIAGWFYLGQRDKAVTYQVREGAAVATSEQCSKGTEQLETQAAQRAKDAGPARQAAADKNREHQARAQQIMSTPPAVPGDECASARAERDSWWAQRAKP